MPEGALRIGVLGTGGVVRLAVPQMQQAATVNVAAIASRSAGKAEAVARDLGIGKAYGGYDALLADPGIEAVYLALPPALHTEWTLRALAAGKHVLCEKPLAGSSDVTVIAAEAARRGLIVWEGLMVRHHPQWTAVSEIIAAGRIGEARAVQGMLTRTPPNAFDPDATANQAELGGGVLFDSGCYVVHFARLAFGAEPQRVAAITERDPATNVITFATGTMQFRRGTAGFTVSSRLRRFQRLLIVGSEGSLDVRVPVMPHPARPTQVIADFCDTALTGDPEVLEFSPVASFRLQAENFADAIRNGTPVPFGLASSRANALALEALERSASENGAWIDVKAAAAGGVSALYEPAAD